MQRRSRTLYTGDGGRARHGPDRSRNDEVVCGRFSCVAAACAILIAGCGSSVTIKHSPAHKPTRADAAACTRPALLRSGVSVSGWRLGAIDFLTATSGVGVTAASIPCEVPVTGGFEGGLRPQSVILAVTDDGSTHWVTEGRPLTLVVHVGVQIEGIAATSTGRIWVLSSGEVFATTDTGGRWQKAALARPVVRLTRADGHVWALSCSSIAAYQCRPVLARAPLTSGRWERRPLPRITSGLLPQLLVAGQAVIVAPGPVGTPQKPAASTDAGRQWTRPRLPDWAGHPCSDADQAAAAARTWWLLCLGGAAAGSSMKGLLRTTDGGRSWTTVSEVTSLTSSPRTGAISLVEPAALAAGSRTRLWLALEFGLSESDNAGATWSYVRDVNPEGWPAQFDVLSPTTAWLLAQGQGLWRTTDGSRWSPA